MKPVPRVVILVLVLVAAACGSSSSGGSPSASSPIAGSPIASSPIASSSSASSSRPSSPSTSASYTVSGLITKRGTGAPYPNAYVRFGWLVNAIYEKETHTVTDRAGRYAIQLPAGQYQATAGDSCDLNAGFAIVGKARDDVMITVPGTSRVDFVEYPVTPGAVLPGSC